MMKTRGMTLIEMMVALIIFVVVMSGALGSLRQQSMGFNRGTEDMNILQNMRFAADLVDQEVRTAGTNLAADQPPVVYAGANAFAFSADYVSNVANDPFSVYVDPDAPAGQVTGWAQANATPIPGSNPGFSYPLADYANNMAETISLFFELDTSTPNANDWVLRRQVNDQPSEPLTRNVMPFPGRTFFRYLYLNGSRIDTVPSGWYPMAHNQALYTGVDTGTIGRINNLRGVEVNYTVTNGKTGAALRSEVMSFIVSLPNSGLDRLQSCGSVPLLGIVPLAVTGGWQGAETVELTWLAALDETGGEQDVLRYVIWRRLAGAPSWGDPYRSIPAGNANYLFSDPNVQVGETWEYQVAAQDCTPSISVRAQSNQAAVITGPPQP